MKTTAIIQARLTSTRLQGKVLMDLEGVPLLSRLYDRVLRARTLEQVALAIPETASNDPLAEFCSKAGMLFFRGSENDVLDRFYLTAKKFDADPVVRITADCPLIDADVIDRVVSDYKSGGADYVSNTLRLTFPDGLDTEVMTFHALGQAYEEARLSSEREHVTPYIWKHPELFRTRSILNDRDLSALRWTVDEPRDFEFVLAVYQEFGNRYFGMREVLQLIDRRPELAVVNRGIPTNAGYAKSLAEDRILADKK